MDMAQQCMIDSFRREGRPVPKWLASHATNGEAGQQRPDLRTTLKTLEATLTDLRGIVDAKKAFDPFEGRAVTGLFLAPNGEIVKQVRVGPDEGQQYAGVQSPWDDSRNAARPNEPVVAPRTVLPEREYNAVEPVRDFALPTSPWARQLDGPTSIEQRFPDAKNPDGDPRGDALIAARRRETFLRRELDVRRKRLRSAAFADRERIEAEITEMAAELAEVTRRILKGGTTTREMTQ